LTTAILEERREKADDTNIKVCIRVRPFNKREEGEACIVKMPSRTRVTILADAQPEGFPAEGDRSSMSLSMKSTLSVMPPRSALKQEEARSFEFDRCFWSFSSGSSHFASQETLMNELGEEVLDHAIAGFNSCLFAYGQTGAGKTFSVLGPENPPEQQGLLPRVIASLFERIGKIKLSGAKCTCKVSYLEIYNERIRDLLIPIDSYQGQAKLEVRTHPRLGPYVPGLTQDCVTEYAQVKKLMDFGAKSRTIGATNMNAGSSRSHCIFCFQYEVTERIDGQYRQLRSRVNLVDLAGSERVGKTGACGQRLKEGAFTNQSLSNLAVVINKLAEASTKKNVAPGFVPYRNSKLTQLLQESLSGNSKTVLLAAISPAASNYDENLSTLRFASTCKNVITHASVNEESNDDIIEGLKADIEMLTKMTQHTQNLEAEAKLRESEELRRELEKDFESRLREQKVREETRANALAKMGLTFEDMEEEFGISPDTPKLINISDDPSLSGSLLYMLEIDKDTFVGEDPSCQIVLEGIGIHPYMCVIRNDDNKKVTMTLLSPVGSELVLDEGYQAGSKKSKKGRGGSQHGRILLNGGAASSPKELRHMDRLILGYAYAFRVLIPLQQGEAAPNQPRKSVMNRMEANLEELVQEVELYDPESSEDLRASIAELKTRFGPQRLTGFLAVVKEAVPLVREANEITQTMRPKDRLEFKIEFCYDIMAFPDDQPELVVRLLQTQEPGNVLVVCDVWEFSSFKERLEQMRLLYTATRQVGGRKSIACFKVDLDDDPWYTYTYRDIVAGLEPLRAKAKELHTEKGRRMLLAAEEGSKRELEAKIKELRQELAEKDALKAELQGTLLSLGAFRNGEGSAPREHTDLFAPFMDKADIKADLYEFLLSQAARPRSRDPKLKRSGPWRP
jgi:hypothetical protein